MQETQSEMAVPLLLRLWHSASGFQARVVLLATGDVFEFKELEGLQTFIAQQSQTRTPESINNADTSPGKH
jgi:hypothetical protein